MGRVDFDTGSYAYEEDQRKLSRYRNPYKHPDTLGVADAHFDGATSYTEQYIPTRTRTPGLARHPWETSNMIAAGHWSGDLEKTTTNDEYYKQYEKPGRPDLAWKAKNPHILPQGGVDGETEYEDRYVPKRWRDGRVMPGWYTWQQAHSHQQRSPFGMSAKKFDEYHDRGSRRSSSRSRPDSFSSSL